MNEWTEERIAAARRANNPENQPIGHFTGRCGRCGSTDLWDDATAYGCNQCDAFFATGDIAPRVIENGTGRDFG